MSTILGKIHKFTECIAQTIDSDQISACTEACKYAANGPPGLPKVAAIGLCAACVAGKGFEVGSCFSEHCKIKKCCEK